MRDFFGSFDFKNLKIYTHAQAKQTIPIALPLLTKKEEVNFISLNFVSAS